MSTKVEATIEDLYRINAISHDLILNNLVRLIANYPLGLELGRAGAGAG